MLERNDNTCFRVLLKRDIESFIVIQASGLLRIVDHTDACRPANDNTVKGSATLVFCLP